MGFPFGRGMEVGQTLMFFYTYDIARVANFAPAVFLAGSMDSPPPGHLHLQNVRSGNAGRVEKVAKRFTARTAGLKTQSRQVIMTENSKLKEDFSFHP